MKMMQRLILCGVMMLGAALPSMASASSFNDGDNNWDSMGWDRGGYFCDYYPNDKACKMEKRHYHHLCSD